MGLDIYGYIEYIEYVQYIEQVALQHAGRWTAAHLMTNYHGEFRPCADRVHIGYSWSLYPLLRGIGLPEIGIPPIAGSRGLPADMSLPVTNAWREACSECVPPCYPSWLYLDEVFEYDWERVLDLPGTLDPRAGQSVAENPRESTHERASGPLVNAEAPGEVVRWRGTVKEYLGENCVHFLDGLWWHRNSERHSVRLVFWLH